MPLVRTSSNHSGVLVAAPEIRDFGYVEKKTLKNGAWYITIQYAELLHGDAAREAAIEDGEIGEDEDLEDDVYVREGEHEIGTFKVDSIATILLHKSSDTPPTRMAPEKFMAQVGGGEDNHSELANAPYWFTLVGDRITKIEQQYLP